MIATSKPVVAPKVAVAAPKRAAVVAHAQADRRAVIGGVVAGIVALVADKAQAGVTNVDLFDDRKAKNTGFDIIYEARDLDLPQSVRDGISQYRSDVAASKSRFAESTKRIDELGTLINKAYWTDAREALRLQLGNLRQDINNLASTKPTKADKKAALGKAQEFIQVAEKLDYAMRKKDAAAAGKAYAELKTSLAELTSTLA